VDYFHSALDIPQAVAAMRTLVAENGQDPAMIYHVGWCLLQSGQLKEAAHLFDRVNAMPGCNGYARYAAWALSNTMIVDGRYEDAVKVLMAVSAPEVHIGQEVEQ
jgi:hypothetical protein